MSRAITALFALNLLCAPLTYAATIAVDYDHTVAFSSYKTYTWSAVHTGNSITDDRVQRAVDAQLTAHGWKRVESNGDVSLVVFETTKDQPSTETVYNGLGGGFGGWGWRGFGGGGFGVATTNTIDNEVGTLAIDMFDSKTHKLIWRGKESDAVSNNASKNEALLKKDLKKMFVRFPPA